VYRNTLSLDTDKLTKKSVIVSRGRSPSTGLGRHLKVAIKTAAAQSAKPEFGLSCATHPPGNKLPWLTANVRCNGLNPATVPKTVVRLNGLVPVSREL